MEMLTASEEMLEKWVSRKKVRRSAGVTKSIFQLS